MARSTRVNREDPFPSEDLEHHRGLVMGLGAVQILAGLFAIGSNVWATLASVVFFGFILLAAGIVQVVLAFSGRGWQGLAVHVVLGVLSFVSGVLLLRAPWMGEEALTLLLAAWLLVGGIAETIYAIAGRHRHWGLSLIGGIVSGVLGVLLLLQFPVSALWFLGLYIGIRLVLQGVTWMTVGAAARRGADRLHPAH